MAQVLHGSATTTARIRAQIQSSQEPIATLARRLGLDRKTVRKWRSRSSICDLPMGPTQRKSAVLSEVEEAAVVAVRVQTRLSLDDLYSVMRDAIPHLSRSTLHRALQRHGVSRLPCPPRDKVKRFKAYEIGYFHLDICELRTAEGKAHLFVAVDRTSKLVFARLYRKANKLAAQAFLKVLIRTVPYKIHTVLTDNGVQFSDLARTGEQVMVHPFTRLCWANSIEHRLTKPYHPWTNGQAERTVRTIKDATVHAFHYATIWELRRHIADWLAAYNFARQLKALRWRTPMEAITAVWQQKPELFHHSPGHYTPGPNT
jgi:transposase InsO family protein